MQRLFWSFARGWSGVGLLIQRMMAGVLLFLDSAGTLFAKAPQSTGIATAILGVAGGVLLSLGLWTPIAGTVVVAIEVWKLFSHPTRPVDALTLAILGATLAMIGPGAWSVDAQLFGRKHISFQ